MTATAPDLHPLLRAVIAEPEDDTVRLAYADWLDESGVEWWAQFIRVHCSTASDREKRRAEVDIWEDTRAVLDARKAFLPDESWSWFYAPAEPAPHRRAAIVSRGFISEVRCTCADLLDHADALCRHPVEKVVLTDKEPWSLGHDCWGWAANNHMADRWRDALPTSLAHRMPKLSHPTREAAVDALSAAAVHFLRFRAGVVPG